MGFDLRPSAARPGSSSVVRANARSTMIASALTTRAGCSMMAVGIFAFHARGDHQRRIIAELDSLNAALPPP
jgi:hypothetical protein